jgi:hypothetical protein
MKTLQILMFFTIAGLFLACTNSPSNNDNSSGSLLPGYFTGTAGAEQSSQHYEEFNGSARYSISDEDTTFSIVLTSTISPGDTTQILLQTKSFELPDEASFTLRNINSADQIYFGGFSLFYHSALTNKNEVYFSESGTLNVSEITTIGIKGTLEGTVFQKAYTGKNEYVRIYSSLNLDFYAISGD